MCIWAANLIYQCISNLTDYFIWGVLYGAAAAPIILGAYFYIRFFMDPEDKDRRLGTQKACMLVILSSFASTVLALLQWMMATAVPFGYFLGVCVSSGIIALFYFYYAGVCKRYASQA